MTLEVSPSNHHFFKKISPTAGDRAKEPQKKHPEFCVFSEGNYHLDMALFPPPETGCFQALNRDVKNSNASQSQAVNIND